MAAEQFCLRWNNFQSNIASALGSLKAEQDLVDVTLTCAGRSVKAHKVILSACSPYFRSVFKENPCQHPVVILKDVRYDDVLALLSFMYQGEVFITQDQLASFLETAELLQVRGLTGAVNPVTESPPPKSGQIPSLAPPPLSSLLQKANAFPKSGTLGTPTSTHSASTSPRIASITTHQLKQALGATKRSAPLPSRSASPPLETAANKDQSSAPSSPQPAGKRRKAVPRRVSTSSLASSDLGTDAANSNSSVPDPSRASEDSLSLLEQVSVNLSEVKQEPPDANSDSVAADNELDNDEDGEVYNDRDRDGEDHDRDQGEDSRSGFYMDLEESNEAGTSSLLARSLAGVSPRSTDGQGTLATNNQTSATDLTASGDGPKGGALQCGTCPHCGQNYSNLSALKYHVRLVHSDLTNRLCCHLCPRSFVQREQYRQHMWDKHGTRN